jgi:protein-tyrosine-phosphatase
VGATRGKNLFEGLHLTMKYFYDAVGAAYAGSLTYREIEKPGDIQQHATVRSDIQAAVADLLAPFRKRKKILFTCRDNACLSQMAGAFARMHAGDRLDVLSAGSQPADKADPFMVEAMQEKGIDMGFCSMEAIQRVLETQKPERIISLGGSDALALPDGVHQEFWPVAEPRNLEAARQVRDAIEVKVLALIPQMS